MSFANGLMIFFIIWWVAIFAILPFGVKHPQQLDKGIMAGTPAQPDIKKIVIRTTILSIILWLMIYALVEADAISFSLVAKQHALEDGL